MISKFSKQLAQSQMNQSTAGLSVQQSIGGATSQVGIGPDG